VYKINEKNSIKYIYSEINIRICRFDSSEKCLMTLAVAEIRCTASVVDEWNVSTGH
jgi:hypothetical protein